jgi:hypothetical protein
MVVDTGDAPARLAVKTTGDNSAVFTLAADRGQVTKLEFLDGSLTYLASQVIVSSSLVIGLTELSATATDGFVYLPACAGPPTGVPAPHAGTAAAVIDGINAKLWVWCGTAGKGAALS